MPQPFALRFALPTLASFAPLVPLTVVGAGVGAGDDLELTPVPLAEGQTLDLACEVSYELDFEVSSSTEDLPGFEMSYERMTEKTVTILSSSAENGLEAIRVIYHLVDELGEGPGIDGEQDEAGDEHPLDGTVATIRRDGRGWAVVDNDDVELDEDLADLVRDEEVRRDRLLFDMRMFTEAVSTMELEQGASVDVDEELAIELLDAALDEDGGVFDDAEMVLTFRDIDEHEASGVECARFLVEVIAHGEVPGDLDVAVELSGEVWLDLTTAFARELELEGEMAVAGDSDDVYGVELEGEGALRIAFRAS